MVPVLSLCVCVCARQGAGYEEHPVSRWRDQRGEAGGDGFKGRKKDPFGSAQPQQALRELIRAANTFTGIFHYSSDAFYFLIFF